MSTACRLILAIDQGTTSTRALLLDPARNAIVALRQQEITQHFPKPAYVEHDAMEIWSSVEACCRGVMESAGVNPGDIASIGITNQRETVIVWNARSGIPYHRALVWQDQRGAPLCQRVSADGGQDRLRPKTGLPIVPYFSASKLAWLLDNVPGLRADAESGEAIAGTVDSWLLWKLTGGAVHATDVTNACRTLLCNIHARPVAAWDEELCSLFRIPMRMLPTIQPSVHRFGVCGPESPLPGVPIGGILGDQQAALFGQTCFGVGEAKSTYGTGCFLLMNTGGAAVPSAQGLLTTIGYQLSRDAPPVYALEGSVAVGGAVVTWLRDNLRLIEGSAHVEAAARTEESSGGVVFVPAFNGLFSPYWRPDARGVLVGLSGFTRQGHIARAALEAVALQCKDLLDAMGRDAVGAGVLTREAWRSAGIKVDGGMTVNSLLMQFQADVCRKRVVRPTIAETTALGAAYAAGLSSGVYSSLEELQRRWTAAATWEPSMPAAKALDHVTRWHSAVARAVNLALPDTDDKSSVASEATSASVADGSSTPAAVAEDSTKPTLAEEGPAAGEGHSCVAAEAAAEAAIFASQPALPPLSLSSAAASAAAAASASSARAAGGAGPSACPRCAVTDSTSVTATGAFSVTPCSVSAASAPVGAPAPGSGAAMSADADGLRLQSGAAGSVNLSQALVLCAAGIIAGLCLRDALDGFLRRGG